MNSIALLTASGTESASALSLVVSMLPLVLVIVIMYFMLIRPQKKKEKYYFGVFFIKNSKYKTTIITQQMSFIITISLTLNKIKMEC